MARRLLILATSLAALQALSISAFSAEMPRYDVESWCETVSASAGGTSAMIYNGCFDQEQESYTDLKRVWDEVPDKTRHWCNEVARSGGSGSYMILKGCVDQEIDAKREQAGKTFRY